MMTDSASSSSRAPGPGPGPRRHRRRWVARADRPLADRLDQLQAAHVGQPQVEDHAVEPTGLEGVEGLPGRAHGGAADVAVADQFQDALALRRVILDDEQVPARRAPGTRGCWRRPPPGPGRRWASAGTRGRRSLSPRSRSSRTEMTWTGICRVSGECLRRSSTAQPSMPGIWMSSMMASGPWRRARSSPASPREATRPLKPVRWAISSRMRANRASSSMINRVRSPGPRSRRSSATSSGDIAAPAGDIAVGPRRHWW